MSDLPAWALEKAQEISSWHHDSAPLLVKDIAVALVAERAAERERCAKECDRIAGNTKDFDRDFRRAAGSCAAAIRNQEPER